MKAYRFLFAALAVLALITAPAMATETFTVGDFLVAIGQADGLPVDDGADAHVALTSRGFALPAKLALDSPLTEGEVVRIARGLGLRVATTRPDAPFGAAQGASFVSAFVNEWSADDSNGARGDEGEEGGEGADGETGGGPDFDPYSKGKGKAKSKGKGKQPPFSPVD